MDPKTDPATAGSMTTLEHLTELRNRIIVSLIAALIGSIVAFVFFEPTVAFLMEPFRTIDAFRTPSQQLFVTTLFEGYVTKIKISVLAGTILTFPIHLYNAIRFTFPALDKKEKTVVVISLITSFLLIILSFFYSYYKIIPISVRFLTSDHFIPIEVGMLLNYDQNIFYILQFIFVSLIIFQVPILLEVLLIMRVVARKTLLKASRYVIVAVFVLSALLTPPDFISQVSLSVPLIVLYFLTIFVAWIFKFGEG